MGGIKKRHQLGVAIIPLFSTAKLKIVRQTERGRAPYFMCIVEHEAEVQDPVILEFREFIESDSTMELMQGLAEANRTLLLEDALEA